MHSACALRAETIFGIIHRVCETEPRPIREINPEIAPWLVSFIERLMAKAPCERFSEAGQVASLLEVELAHLQNPTMVAEPAREWLPRSEHKTAIAENSSPMSYRLKRTIGLSSAVAAACLGLMAWSWSGGRDDNSTGNGNAGSYGPAAMVAPIANLSPQDEPVVTWTREEADEASITSRFVQRTEQAFDAPPNSRIVVNSEIGNFELRQTELDCVSLVTIRRIESATQAEAEKIANYHRVSFAEGETWELMSELDKEFAARSGRERIGEVTFGIGIPEGMTVQLKTTDGDINVASIAGKLELSVRDGNIHCDAIQGDLWARAIGGEIVANSGCTGSVDLMATHGNVCVNGIEGTARLRASHGNIYIGSNKGDVSAHATGGDVRIAEISSPTRAHVETGEIILDLAASPSAESSLSVTGGNIKARVTSDTAANFNIHSNQITINNETRTVEGNVLEFPANGGGETIDLTALNGSVPSVIEPETRVLAETESPYFSLGGSGNKVARLAASREALEKTSGAPRPGAIVPIEIENGENIDGYTLYLPSPTIGFG
ncbi:MAG: DUF4097 family beta strand repeat-containing protein [Pirellulaceae bacterium]